MQPETRATTCRPRLKVRRAGICFLRCAASFVGHSGAVRRTAAAHPGADCCQFLDWLMAQGCRRSCMEPSHSWSIVSNATTISSNRALRSERSTPG